MSLDTEIPTFFRQRPPGGIRGLDCEARRHVAALNRALASALSQLAEHVDEDKATRYREVAEDRSTVASQLSQPLTF